MPITPQFSLSQNDTSVLVDIRVPHVRVTTESIQVALDTSSASAEESTSSISAGASSEAATATPHYTVLHFSSAPYLLLLNFAPHAFHPDAAEACATYEPHIEGGRIRLSLQKMNPREYWKNLDLVGRLVRPSTKRSSHLQTTNASAATTATTSNWLQSVVSNVDEDENDEDDDGTNQVENLQNNSPQNKIDQGCYGVLRMFHGIFTDLNKDGLAREMLEMPWNEQESSSRSLFLSIHDNRETSDKDAPITSDNEIRISTTNTTTTPTLPSSSLLLDQIYLTRREERLEMEQDKFDEDRWRGDIEIEDDYVYLCAMDMQPHWKQSMVTSHETTSTALDSSSLCDDMNALSITTADTNTDAPKYFTKAETLLLHSLPYPLLPTTISDDQVFALLLTTSDILFAYVYDHLTTSGDPTVESAWTISILSPSLSCLEDYSGDIMHGNANIQSSSISTMLASSLRRSLVYPYIRNLAFARHCAHAVADIWKQGTRCVIRCLLQVRQILNKSELYYLGNKLFVDPILLCLQRDIELLWTNEKMDHFLSSYKQSLEKMTEIDHVGLQVSQSNDDSQSEEDDGSSSSSSSSDEEEGDK